jgi:cysteine-rich repeat protein
MRAVSRLAIALITLVMSGCECSDGPPGSIDGGDGGADASAFFDAPPAPACGDSIVQDDEQCDDGNTDSGDSCRGDCGSDYTCGNGVTDSMADGALRDEACDDGNTTGGDGCNATCDSDESCGNSVVDPTEACDDGNTDGGDTCSADCQVSLLCGNGTTDDPEECDDGNTGDGDGCDASCFVERCGNGRAQSGEACDDGNTDDTDGCTVLCAFTCSADVDCGDADVCNGDETCTDPGTIASRCAPAVDADDGTSCGTGQICLSGACVTSGCGDGFTDAARSEACDDGNMSDGDGCENDCTFTCSGPTDCDDGDVCNGAEACVMGGTTMSTCTSGTAAGDGVDCGAGRICLGGVCTTAGCGDGVVSGAEQCDDSNMLDGDGCDADCTWTCTGAASCTDGNVCNGAEVCTMPSTIGSRCGPGVAPMPGASCGGMNICVGGACVAQRCGDGIVSGAEQCDDANPNNGDGCDNDCTWTCAGAIDCTDGNDCNGVETCTMPGTLGSRCGAGPAPPTGTACDRDGMPGTRDICRMSMCLASVCGDGITDAGRVPPEQCDDSNTMNGDGCSASCQLETMCGDGTVTAGEMCDHGGGCSTTRLCTTSADCAFTRVCIPGQFCDGGANDLERCAVAADCPSGTCRVAMNTCTIGGRQGLGCFATSDCPNGGACTSGTPAGRCGDGITRCNMDAQCAAADNRCIARSIDGCSGRCNNEVAYRLVTMRLADPRVTFIIDVSDMVNGLIQDEIDAYGLNLVVALDPRSTAPGAPAGVSNITSTDCTAAGCVGNTAFVTSNYDVRGTPMVCLQALTGTTNGSIAENVPTASAMGNCLVTSMPVNFTLSFAGINIVLNDARIAAEYRAGTPGTLVDGLIMGFLPEAVANMTYLPSTVDFVGGRSLGSLLNGNDRDMNGAVRGWWLYLNFTATEVPITPRP